MTIPYSITFHLMLFECIFVFMLPGHFDIEFDTPMEDHSNSISDHLVEPDHFVESHLIPSNRKKLVRTVFERKQPERTTHHLQRKYHCKHSDKRCVQNRNTMPRRTNIGQKHRINYTEKVNHIALLKYQKDRHLLANKNKHNSTRERHGSIDRRGTSSKFRHKFTTPKQNLKNTLQNKTISPTTTKNTSSVMDSIRKQGSWRPFASEKSQSRHFSKNHDDKSDRESAKSTDDKERRSSPGRKKDEKYPSSKMAGSIRLEKSGNLQSETGIKRHRKHQRKLSSLSKHWATLKNAIRGGLPVKEREDLSSLIKANLSSGREAVHLMARWSRKKCNGHCYKDIRLFSRKKGRKPEGGEGSEFIYRRKNKTENLSIQASTLQLNHPHNNNKPPQPTTTPKTDSMHSQPHPWRSKSEEIAEFHNHLQLYFNKSQSISTLQIQIFNHTSSASMPLRHQQHSIGDLIGNLTRKLSSPHRELDIQAIDGLLVNKSSGEMRSGAVHPDVALFGVACVVVGGCLSLMSWFIRRLSWNNSGEKEDN